MDATLGAPFIQTPFAMHETARAPDFAAPAEATECPLLELRQYRLHPDQRDTLIDLFDREFIETQEALGLQVLGQFRDLGDPQQFVWLRGFASMAARLQGLSAFYGGPVWAAHRNAANATMIDSDNVLLLRPAMAGRGLAVNLRARAAPGSTVIPPGVVSATVHALATPWNAMDLHFEIAQIDQAAARAGALQSAWYTTEPTPNNFPALPVREGTPMLVHLVLWPTADHGHAVEADPTMSNTLSRRPCSVVVGAPQHLLLAPTARSAWHA
jgi:hypothetical protein